MRSKSYNGDIWIKALENPESQIPQNLLSLKKRPEVVSLLEQINTAFGAFFFNPISQEGVKQFEFTWEVISGLCNSPTFC